MMNYLLKLVTILVLTAALSQARAQDADRFPFVIPWDDSAPTITDVGALNSTPAGGSGFVTDQNGHFYDGKLRRIRFLGVNIVGSACFPDKTTAEKAAARMHKYGINLVRLHHMDADFAHPNIFDPAYQDRKHLSAESLDRLDYFIAQLKQHGIYVDINLHVAREFTAADGFPETDQLNKVTDFDKGVDFFEPRMIQLQKDYARDLLTHLNPYTHTRYTEESCVAMIEINNENTLLGEAWGSKLDNLPPHYKAELQRQWNQWLVKKYTDTTGLKRAWSAADKPLGPNILQNADFARGAEHWNLELNTAPAEAQMSLPDNLALPPGAPGKVIRIDVTTLGTQNWHIQFHQTGLDLVDGEPYTVSFWAKAGSARKLPVYTSLDHGDYHHVGLDDTISLSPEWRKFTLTFTATHTEKDHNRLTFVLGDALGAVDLAGISLQPGAQFPFPAGASLEAGTTPLGHPLNTPAGKDWIAFLIDTEKNYAGTLRDYIKNDLHAHAGVIGSQDSYGGLGGALRESLSDYADDHAYWQHPSFPHVPWDAKDWTIPNTAMTADPNGGELPGLARYRLAGKPFTVSEYNEPAPNDYRAECIPLIATFAAVQDWDGIMLFDYCSSRDEYDSDRIKGYFDIDSDPAKMAFLPAAAMLFERIDMPLAHPEARLHIAASDVPDLMAKNGPWIDSEWESAGIKPLDTLSQRFSVSFDAAGRFGAGSSAGAPADNTIQGQADNGGPITWENMGTNQARFLADSPSSQVMVGFLGGRKTGLGGWEVQMPDGPQRFAALTLTAMDGKEIDESHSLLLTAVGRVENKGMEWNAARTSVRDRWGTGPTQAEGVTATISIKTVITSASVYALDGSGKRAGKVDSKLSGGALTFSIGPADKTLWYEIEADVRR